MSKQTDNKHDLEALFTNPEPWEAWESKLVGGSIIIAVLSLAVLGILINFFLLK